VDIGGFIWQHIFNARVFFSTTYGEALDKWPTALNIPTACHCGNRSLPYVLVGDDIFLLKPLLMKPYPKKTWIKYNAFSTTCYLVPGAV